MTMFVRRPGKLERFTRLPRTPLSTVPLLLVLLTSPLQAFGQSAPVLKAGVRKAATSASAVGPIAPISAAATGAVTHSEASSAKQTTELPAISVVSRSDTHSDPAKNTLETDRATLGPLGTLDRLDTPYSVNVIPQHLIKTQQLKSIADALRYIPSVQGDGARPQSRGIQGSVVQNSRIDGLNAVSTTDYPLEQFDRIEVLNGLAGSLYGPANPAGTFNYIQNRPTDSRLASVTLGYGSQSRFLRQADLSDRVGPGKAIGYRFTLLDETGTGYTDHSTVRRQLGSVAFDFHLSNATVIETNFSHYHYVSKGFPGTFSLAAGVHFPAALDPTNSAYGSTNGGSDNTTDTATVRVRHEFSPDWHVSAAILRQIADRESTAPTNTLIDNAGDYKTTLSTSTASRFTITSNLIYLNGKVHTGPLEHALSIGTSGFIWENFNPVAGGTATLGSASLSDPQSFPLVGVPNFTQRYQSAKSAQQSFMLSDNISVSRQWSLLLSGSQSWLSSHNYSAKGVQTSESADQGLSGAASVIFKPQDNMSVYATYADSLQQGDTAPTGSTNVGNILAPYRSKQWETGYKIALSQVNVSLAAYQITRPFAYTQADGVFRVAGEQRNRGIELMLDGQATRDLSLYGGVTFLDPLLLNTGSIATSDKRIVGLPKFALNLLAEYRVPVLHGLVMDVNVHFISSRPTDDTNTSSVSSYTTLDLGAAYSTKLFGRGVTFRLALDNVTDRRYWTNIVPGGLNGYTGVGNASAQLGAPRTVAASVQFEL